MTITLIFININIIIIIIINISIINSIIIIYTILYLRVDCLVL